MSSFVKDLRENQLLRGKKVFVTGGSGDLGRSIVMEMAKQGADIAFTYLSNETIALELERKVLSLNVKVLKYKVDVANYIEMEIVAKSYFSAWGDLDILVNNSGVTQILPLPLISEEDWNKVLGVNVDGLFHSTRMFLRPMIYKKSGCIINIGSLAGMRILSAPVHYTTSKSAVKGFTEGLAKEVGRYGIRVNCVAPGLLCEGVAKNIPEKNRKEYIENVALKRLGQVEEIAHIVAFMASDYNSYMTGASVIVDGGL